MSVAGTAASSNVGAFAHWWYSGNEGRCDWLRSSRGWIALGASPGIVAADPGKLRSSDVDFIAA